MSSSLTLFVLSFCAGLTVKMMMEVLHHCKYLEFPCFARVVLVGDCGAGTLFHAGKQLQWQ